MDEPVQGSTTAASNATPAWPTEAQSPTDASDRRRSGAKIRFFDALLAKYGTGALGRPKNFYPRLDEVTVYALGVERVTGKHCPLPLPPSRGARGTDPVAERTSVTATVSGSRPRP